VAPGLAPARWRIGPARTVLLVLLGLLLLLPAVGGYYHLQVVALSLVSVLLAVSLSIVTGLCGQVSLAPSAFFTIGAYALALTTTRLGWSFWLAAPAAACVTAALGLLMGLPATRTRGLYFAFVTLMMSLIVASLAVNLTALTGGPLGISGIPRPDLPGFAFVSAERYYYLLLAITVVLCVGALHLAESRLGHTLTAVRDDELAARVLGIDSTRLKVFGFAVSACVAGVAGGLYADFVGFIDPESFPPSLSILVLTMIIIGGVHRIEGAIIGGLLLSILPEALRFSPHAWRLIYGALLVLTVVAFPRGLIALIDRAGSPAVWRGRGARRPPASPPVPVPVPVPPASPAGASAGGSAQGRKGYPPARRCSESAGARGDCSPSGELLRVYQVTRRFGAIVALDHVSFAVPAGSVYGIIGPNGAGKSVLLNVISGFLAPDGGRITLGGVPLVGRSVPSIASLGVGRTFQEPRVFRSLSVLENVLLAGRPKRILPNARDFLVGRRGQSGADDHDRALELIVALGLDAEIDRPAGSLSYGQRKLLALANALQPDPRLVLLDEPAAGISPALIYHIERLIATRRQERGVTFVLVEHDTDVISRCCDRVIALEEGRLFLEGAPQNVLAAPEVTAAHIGG
jgi:branched-chain amino acid transport system permease protein